MAAHSRVKNFVRFNEAALPHFLYLFIVLLVALLSLVSVVFLLSQAVRTAPNRNWTKNVNVIVIGAAYVLVVCPIALNGGRVTLTSNAPPACYLPCIMS